MYDRFYGQFYRGLYRRGSTLVHINHLAPKTQPPMEMADMCHPELSEGSNNTHNNKRVIISSTGEGGFSDEQQTG